MCIILHIRDQDNLSSQGEGQKCYIDVDEGKLVADSEEPWRATPFSSEIIAYGGGMSLLGLKLSASQTRSHSLHKNSRVPNCLIFLHRSGPRPEITAYSFISSLSLSNNNRVGWGGPNGQLHFTFSWEIIAYLAIRWRALMGGFI